MANPNPQHNPTDGLNTAAEIILSGTGITQVAGNVYKVSLNVSGSPNPATVAVTGTVKDVTGANTFASGNGNSVSFTSLNAGTGAGDVARIITVAGGTVTAVHPGQGVVEARFATFDTTDGNDFIYAQLIVTVGP